MVFKTLPPPYENGMRWDRRSLTPVQLMGLSPWLVGLRSAPIRVDGIEPLALLSPRRKFRIDGLEPLARLPPGRPFGLSFGPLVFLPGAGFRSSESKPPGPPVSGAAFRIDGFEPLALPSPERTFRINASNGAAERRGNARDEMPVMSTEGVKGAGTVKNLRIPVTGDARRHAEG